MNQYIRLYKKSSAQKGRLPAREAIEEEFRNSWDWVAELYHIHPCRQQILAFMQSMRDKGYDRMFRAGQSLWVLMLSRSLKHGLRSRQPYVYFIFAEDGLTVGLSTNKDEEVTFAKIELNDYIERLLQKLLVVVIN